jgi:hypothetical protein
MHWGFSIDANGKVRFSHTDVSESGRLVRTPNGIEVRGYADRLMGTVNYDPRSGELRFYSEGYQQEFLFLPARAESA